MVRRPRIDIAGYLYHVTARGNYRQDIFYSDKDKELYMELLAYYQKQLGFRLYAFVLMDNHIHLLLERSDKASLAEIIKSLNGRYSKQCNKRKKKKGHLFQGRFYSVIVEADSYLLELTRYIHLNPVRAGIAERPQDYVWSSCRTYLGLDYHPFVDRTYLDLFGKRPLTKRANYKTFLEEGMEFKKSPLSVIKEGMFLGSADFIKQAKAAWESGLTGKDL